MRYSCQKSFLETHERVLIKKRKKDRWMEYERVRNKMMREWAQALNPHSDFTHIIGDKE